MLKEMIKEIREENRIEPVTGKLRSGRGPYCPQCHNPLVKGLVGGKKALSCPRHGVTRYVRVQEHS